MKPRVRHRIATLNLWVGNRSPRLGVQSLVKHLEPWNPPHAIGLQEASNHLDNLARFPGYSLLQAQGTRARRSNAVLLRDGLELHDHQIIPAALGIEGDPLRPPRFIQAVYYGRGHVLFNTHFHVVDEGFAARTVDTEWPRPTRQYVEHIDKLCRLVTKAKAGGLNVWVTADGNTLSTPWRFAAYRMLEQQCGLAVIRHGVDVIAFDPARWGNDTAQIVRRELVGSDTHDAIALRAFRRPQ